MGVSVPEVWTYRMGLTGSFIGCSKQGKDIDSGGEGRNRGRSSAEGKKCGDEASGAGRRRW